MKYEIRSPIATSIVALLRVADAMATTDATLLLDAKSRQTMLHVTTYEGRFNDHIDLLLREADAGTLRVCDSRGCEGTFAEIVAEARRAGQVVLGSRYLVQPDWVRLAKGKKDREVAPGTIDYTGIELGPTEVDIDGEDQKLAEVVFTTPHWLAEWRGDEFIVVQTPIAAVCPQGYVGEGIRGAKPRIRGSFAAISKPVPAAESAPSPAAVPAPVAAVAEPEHDSIQARGPVMKRAALVRMHFHHWPTIERDMRDAAVNKLTAAAKAPAHGDWYEADALKWARSKGKLNDVVGAQPVNSIFNAANQRHRIAD